MMKTVTFTKRFAAATKGFQSCEFWFEMGRKNIAKVRWHYISVWSIANSLFLHNQQTCIFYIVKERSVILNEIKKRLLSLS